MPFTSNGNVLYRYEYNLKDHLGNVRVTLTAHSSGKPEVNQISSYDPFGMVTRQENWFATGMLKNKYLYNGKELQDDLLAGNKMDWYDYGARFYDAVLGRWHSVDPLAELHQDYTPYSYCFNNPINLIDPLGMDTISAKQANKQPVKKDQDVQMEDGSIVHADFDAVVVTPNENGNEEHCDINITPSLVHNELWKTLNRIENIEEFEPGIYRDKRSGLTWKTKSMVVTGMPPDIIGGPLKNGAKAYNIGKYVFNSRYLHRIFKPKVLEMAGKYAKVVGDNPDIEIKGAKILLKGTKNSPFAGKVYDTGLNLFDLIK